LILSSAATLITAFAESSVKAQSLPMLFSFSVKMGRTVSLMIGVAMNLIEYKLAKDIHSQTYCLLPAFKRRRGVENSIPWRNQIYPTLVRPPEIAHQSSNRKFAAVITGAPDQIEIACKTRLQDKTFITLSRFGKVMQGELRGVCRADEIDVYNAEVWLRWLIGYVYPQF
jgi:hypothetical protein